MIPMAGRWPIACGLTIQLLDRFMASTCGAAALSSTHLETAREDIQVDGESIEGYADEEAPDYPNAAAQVARASGVSEKRIASTLKKESNDERSRRARSEDAAEQPVVVRDTGAVRGFTASEKRRFNGATVIRSERSNRGDAAGSPRAYERRGRAATAKARLVKKIGAKVIAEYGPARRLRNAVKVVGDSARYQQVGDGEDCAADPQGVWRDGSH